MYISPACHFDTDVERGIVVLFGIETRFREGDMEAVDIIALHIIMVVTVQHTVAVDRRSEDARLVRFHQGRLYDQ